MTARNQRQKRPPAPPSPAVLDSPGPRLTRVYLGAVSVMAVVCFFPLLRYFFAQDDLILMNNVYRNGAAEVLQFFARQPGHFRPATKGLYFWGMYDLFGLNPTPYHVVSMTLHVLNTLLVYQLLRRFAVRTVSALIATTLFALSVAFFHVVGWISCIQQLLAECLMLASLIAGIDGLRDASPRKLWISLAWYVGALFCLEQTFGVPILLFAFAFFNLGRWPERPRFQKTFAELDGHFGVLILYLAFILVWKRAPTDGPYAFAFGKNLWANIASYWGWMLQFWVLLPSWMSSAEVRWSLSHALLLVLVGYHVARRRWGVVVFGLLYFTVALVPALPLQNHTYYLHTYIPAPGILLLIAFAVDDLLGLPVLIPRRWSRVLLGAVFVFASTMSFVMVRKNENAPSEFNPELRRSFVVRRALIAKATFDSVSKYQPFDPDIKKVLFVYGRPQGRDEAKWNMENVIAAIGEGTLFNLIYQKPNLKVLLKVEGDAVSETDVEHADVYFYDDLGNATRVTDRFRD